MTIYHIVLLKFKRGITPADAEKVMAGLEVLRAQIPAISDIKVGQKIKHPLDRDFDQGVIFVFKDEDAIKDYDSHEAHRAYQKSTAPYIEDKLIFNIDSEE